MVSRTSYSLPGHVLISISALPVPLGGRSREVRELQLVVEGMSEYFDSQGKQLSREYHLPLTLSRMLLAFPTIYHHPQSRRCLTTPPCDHDRPGASRLQLAMPFDLRLPG